MKKLTALSAAALLSFTAIAQNRESNSPFESSPFGSAARISRCGICNQRHSPGCTSSGTTTNAPIDGGVALLLAAGVAYGLKRRRNKTGIAGR